MRNNSAIVLGLVVLSVLFAAGCAVNAVGNVQTGGDSGEDQARLEIKGDSGTEFSGSCTVGDGGTEEIGGQVPQSFTYDLNGNPLRCEIASEDDIEVNLTVGNTRSVQRVSGGTLNLTYDNGSISSSTSSSSVSSSSSSSQQVVVSSSGGTDETSCTIEGSGNVESESRDVSGFDEVELRGVGNLSIRQTGSESLSVEAEDNVLPKITTKVVNGRLILSPEPDTSIQTTEPINYELTVKDLRALKVSGSGDVEARGIGTDNLGIDIGGSGDVKISGRADSQEVSISGSGDYRAKDLQSKEAKVDVSGSGSAIVNASKALEAKVSGAGSVEYVGDPTVEEDVSGAGRVSGNE
jgi:hypothetical protein